ncbi:MAG: DUF3473 domain-containing protein, partial [Planctomycetes bacterium]|nr:DUF3473 domain-containing protein [Planctomycetota bacterium]
GLRQKDRLGVPGCLYLHPWEVDPAQPRQRLGGLRGFRHYVNLKHTLGKLDRLLGDFRFVGLSEALAERHVDGAAGLPSFRAADLLG